jgi:hypothetical protein
MRPLFTGRALPNGDSWTQLLTPSGDHPDGDPGEFKSLAVVSAQDFWAVGTSAGQSLIEHRDGGAWSRVPAPNPVATGGSVVLQAVSAASAADVWAVGENSDGKTVIVHWNGTAWTIVPPPPTPTPAGA